ncbi:MFS transporter [Saliterribacillus persicus]|uniref:MFS transporter n=1 Tax=Saliterribacillus persicus TaxID=930114 RepID=A0A368XD76_9BACI|nr:MFS transporter [Saliterribacillus persicus]RCW65900.1 MFS transporter [Saliterribacillus persicus]
MTKLNRVLLNKNFSLLLGGRFLTNIVDSIYYITIMWMVFEMTGSSLYTGIAGALILTPEMLGFLYGPLIDKINKRNLLIFSTVMQALLLLSIPIMELSNTIHIVTLLAIVFFVALFTEFTYPAETALLPAIVEKDDLVKANSFFSIAKQGTDLAFNALAGILISVFSITAIFFMDIFLLLIVLFLFSFIKIPSKVKAQQTSDNYAECEDGKYKIKQYLNDLKEGFNTFKKPLFLKMIVPLVIINFVFSGVTIIFPALSVNLGGESWLYGLLMACFSGGMMIGSVFSNSISSKVDVGYMMGFGYLLSGVFWILMSISSSHSIILTCIFLLLSGLPIGATNVIYSTLFQILPNEDMIARITTLTFSLITLAMPIGSVLSGLVSDLFNPILILLVNGIMISLLGVNWLISGRLRNLPNVSKMDSSVLE